MNQLAYDLGWIHHVPRIFVFTLVLVLSVTGAKGVEPTSSPENSAAATGNIRGQVVYVANPQKPWRLGRYYIRSSKTGEIAEAIVALDARQLKAPDAAREPATVTVDQNNFQFDPELIAIRTGDSIRFLNSDNQTHNVSSSHPKHAFNVTMPVGGKHEELFRESTGTRQPHKIGCVFHSAMRMWIFVFDHPWYSVTGKDGQFELKQVPPGEYQLDTVHAAGELRTRQTVQVIAGQTTEIRVELQAGDGKP